MTMDNLEKQMIAIVNRNHECRTIMERIDRYMDCYHLGIRLKAISARRKCSNKK